MYEYALIELNKLEAPSLLLEDYNYFINKAVQQYINLIYAKLELDQQSVDDLRVLKTSTILTPLKLKDEANVGSLVSNTLMGHYYYADLPADYLHMINCIVEYQVNRSNFKCYDKNDSVFFAARRLTSDMYAQIINNAYLRPTYKRPYYYIDNINQRTTPLPTDPILDHSIIDYPGGSNATTEKVNAYYTALTVYNTALDNYNTALDAYNLNPSAANQTALTNAKDALNNAKATLNDKRDDVDTTSSLIDSQNDAYDRLANPSIVRLELRFGKDDSVFTPVRLYVDYVKAPMYIRLTQEQIDTTLDTSQVLEFPDYVCFEIVNIFTRLLMENASDPRLQTNMPINNTIANPALQQQAAQNNK